MPLNNKDTLSLGNIYSKEFKFNSFEFINTYYHKDSFRLEFYTYKDTCSGYKFRHVDQHEKTVILILNFPKDVHLFNPEVLLKLIYNNYYSEEDSIERLFKRDNCLGEYSDPFNESFDPDYTESLNSDIYVDINYKKAPSESCSEKEGQ